jgi:hypothetical protein
MKANRFLWVWLLLALVLGFGLGLAYSWAISPVEYVDAEPLVLRDDFKDHYRAAIAAAYASTGDLERARARLTLLGDPDPSQTLTAQAQRMLAAGESTEAVQQVALLAAALQGQAGANLPTETLTNTPEPLKQPVSTPTSTSTSETGLPTPEIEPTNTSVPISTATTRPTRTPTPTLGAPYQLVGQDTVCDPELAEGLLQIVVINITRKQIPGAEVIITWSGGEEHIFTGLKPELGNGYADFLMAPDVTYSVRMADGGTPASGISASTCTGTDGSTYLGGLLITFQQP